MTEHLYEKGLMRILRSIAWALSACLMIPGAGVAYGQGYPNKPLRIVTADPGGTADVVARLIAQGISVPLGQPVVVQNQGGAGGIIAAQTVMKAPPDGYTLLFFSSGIWILPLLQNVPYDSVKDFLPVTLADKSPSILAVTPSLPVKSVKELIAYAKARPGELNFGTVGAGGTSHLAAELFKSMAGVNIVRVNYKGTGPALTDLIGGQLQLMFTTPGSVAPHVKSGRLRALAVTGAQASALAPELPTASASGLPGFEVESAHGFFAPAGTPKPIIGRLNEEIVRVLNRDDVKEKLLASGIEIVGNSPEQFAATIKAEMTKFGKVIKDAGIGSK